MAIPQVTNPKLEAVNIMLSCIGESPVNSLVSGLADAEAAELILNRISKEAQTEGWSFNTRINYTLPVNESNEIPIPVNTLRLSLVDTSRGYPLTQRGSRLYDYEENSYTVGVTYPTVKVNLVEQHLTRILHQERRFQSTCGATSQFVRHGFSSAGTLDPRTSMDSHRRMRRWPVQS